MDNPIFKLEKVVQTKASEPLEDFEGPLDLILFLLSKNKIEIQDIPFFPDDCDCCVHQLLAGILGFPWHKLLL